MSDPLHALKQASYDLANMVERCRDSPERTRATQAAQNLLTEIDKHLGKRRYRSDVEVTLGFGLDQAPIETIQAIEKALDQALAPFGFSRSMSGKGPDLVDFHYRQTLKANKETNNAYT